MLQNTVVEEEEDEDRIAQQAQSFIKWSNMYLSRHVPPRIVNELVDFGDGLSLVYLIEELVNKDDPSKSFSIQHTRKPAMAIHRQSNITECLDVVQPYGITVTCQPSHFLANSFRPKMVLGFLWQLILHFQLSQSGRGADVGSTSAETVRWVNDVIQETRPDLVLPDDQSLSCAWLRDGQVLQEAVHVISPASLEPRLHQLNDETRLDTVLECSPAPQMFSAHSIRRGLVGRKELVTYLSTLRSFQVNELVPSQVAERHLRESRCHTEECTHLKEMQREIDLLREELGKPWTVRDLYSASADAFARQSLLLECDVPCTELYEEGEYPQMDDSEIEQRDVEAREQHSGLRLMERHGLSPDVQDLDVVERVRDISGVEVAVREMGDGIQEPRVTHLDDDEELPYNVEELLMRLQRMNELRVDSGSNMAKYHLSINELYFRKGRRVHYNEVADRHSLNKSTEGRYRDLVARIEALHEGVQEQLDLPAHTPGRASTAELLAMRKSFKQMVKGIKRDKREWVAMENRLGAIYEPKTQVEVFLESMRLKLLNVLRNPRKYLDDEEQLEKLKKRIVFLNEELERDNDLHDELRQHKKASAEARRKFDARLMECEGQLRDVWQQAEIARLRAELEKVHWGITPQMGTAVSLAMELVEFMLLNYATIFDSAARMTNRAIQTVDQLVREPVRLIEASHLMLPDLYRRESAHYAKCVDSVALYAAQGYSVQLDRVTDGYVLAGVVKRYFADSGTALLPHTFLQVDFKADPGQAARRLRKMVHRLPPVRRVTTMFLMRHLYGVQLRGDDNRMSARGLARVFAPLILKNN